MLFEKGPHSHWDERESLEVKGLGLGPTRAFWRAEILRLDERGAAPATLFSVGIYGYSDTQNLIASSRVRPSEGEKG